MRKNDLREVAPPHTRDKDLVTTLQKGLEVLTCFGRQHGRLTVSEAASLTSSSPAAARRSLKTLEWMGYLATDGKHYWMEPKVLLMAQSYLSSRPMPSLAQPLLDALSERTRESASLGLLQGNDAIIVARSTARRSLSTGLGVGSRLPAYCSALGRVLLASFSQDKVVMRVRQMVCRQLTPRTVGDAEKVIAMIQSCREQGYASNDEELELGVRSIAVPVLDRHGRVVSAMSMAVRSERMAFSEFQESYLPVLRRASQNLSTRLFPQKGGANHP
jgi:IclR family transcriptional regulator, pca regulon regulatory protein